MLIRIQSEVKEIPQVDGKRMPKGRQLALAEQDEEIRKVWIPYWEEPFEEGDYSAFYNVRYSKKWAGQIEAGALVLTKLDK